MTVAAPDVSPVAEDRGAFLVARIRGGTVELPLANARTPLARTGT